MNGSDTCSPRASAQIFVRSSEQMPELESASVQLLFESPPYERMNPCCEDADCLSQYCGADFVNGSRCFCQSVLGSWLLRVLTYLTFRPRS